MADLKDTFFTQYGKYFPPCTSQKNDSTPFKNHPQFPNLVDILSRKHHHHVLLCADFSSNLHSTFFEALLHHLAHEQPQHYLKEASLIYLNLEHTALTELKQLAIEKDFEFLRELLSTTGNYLFIALSRTDIFAKEPRKPEDRFLRRQLETLLSHPHCRVLLLAPTKDYPYHAHLEELFTPLHLAGPTESDIFTTLKQHKHELELFHHVTIPDELLPQASLFAERFLSTTQSLEKTLLLLDSSAARARTLSPPVVTATTLLHTLSDWTQIPTSHLQIHSFKHADFIQGLHQTVFGQETAIAILGHELLQAQAHLQLKTGPFSCFLFAGPAHSGKKTMALALAEQLFNQLDVLYFAQPSSTQQLLTEVKLQCCAHKHFQFITDIIRQKPYAIIVFENIEKLPASMLDGLQEILTTGYLHDSQGNPHDFRQSIIILNTTVGSSHLAEFAETHLPDEDIFTMDLMQLIMNDQKQDEKQTNPTFSSQEIIEKISPDITSAFSAALCQQTHLVPFLPLNKSAIEKIVRQKLKLLGKQLENRYGIDLGYAPEVIRFLTHDTLIKGSAHQGLKPLYFSVEQAILNQTETPNRSNQLFLQLNENGNLLKCEWQGQNKRCATPISFTDGN